MCCRSEHGTSLKLSLFAGLSCSRSSVFVSVSLDSQLCLLSSWSLQAGPGSPPCAVGTLVSEMGNYGDRRFPLSQGSLYLVSDEPCAENCYFRYKVNPTLAPAPHTHIPTPRGSCRGVGRRINLVPVTPAWTFKPHKHLTGRKD